MMDTNQGGSRKSKLIPLKFTFSTRKTNDVEQNPKPSLCRREQNVQPTTNIHIYLRRLI